MHSCWHWGKGPNCFEMECTRLEALKCLPPMYIWAWGWAQARIPYALHSWWKCSLKRIIQCEDPPPIPNEELIHPILGASSESTDTQDIGIGLYLTNKQVDKWSKETLAVLSPAYKEDEDDDNPCAERWRNMRMALTAKMSAHLVKDPIRNGKTALHIAHWER